MHTNRRTQRGGRHGFNGQDVNLIRNSHRDELQKERLVCVNVLYFFEVDYSPDNRTPFFSLLTTKIYNSVESELLNSNFPLSFSDMHDPAKNVAVRNSLPIDNRCG